MNNRLKTIGLIAALFVLFMTACTFTSTEKSNSNFPAIPTSLPETIEEAVKEAEEEADSELPLALMNIAQVPMMYYQDAEEVLAPYHEMLEGMIFTKAIDLEVVDIVDDSANAQRGFMFEALITVRNNGFVTSPQVKLDCDVAGGDDIGGWTWVAPLAPGETRDVRTGFTSSSLAGGTYNYTCTIDADNTLIEINKLNNAKTITINPVMTKTDLVVLSVEELKRTAVIGYDHEFKVTIENVGPGRSYKVLMRCSYQKTIATEEEQIVWVGQMANAGDTVEVICGFNGVPAGAHTLNVEVDWGNMIDEKNEKNNLASLKFTE